jgi:hypothetical protein
MVGKCANPLCDSTFRYFGQGRLFAFELRSPSLPCRDVPRAICEKHPSHATVCFWLCECCSCDLTVTFSASEGMQVVPRTDELSAAPRDQPGGEVGPLIPCVPTYDILPGVPL